ncbi:tyrosine-type recombinase/integrase [Rhodovulum marinum]|uniref:Site-specific recombinase XerD n=1 Tax=Rhodovulum marinum TaxID=320662 RepID=A0A4R2PXM2_9RHOB|nr:integrase arm-type DNA-binding domain-containing protein [Rhodovulum marinum]TCP40860.1 site-specific recombinase XerD [Rhodovulum marinum]
MPKAKITTRLVSKAETDNADLFIWDTDLPGFGLRVKAPDTRSFVIQYRDAVGRSKRVTLGRFPVLTVDEARTAARKELARVRLGGDPRAERDAIRNAWTVADLCADYMQAVETGNLITRRGAPKSESTIATDRGRIERHILPLLAKKPVRDLSRKDVAAFFAAVKTGKTAADVLTGKPRGRAIVEGGQGTAKRTTGLLSAILTYAVEQGVIDANPALGVRLPKDGRRSVNDPDRLYAALGNAIQLAEAKGETWQAVAIIRLVALTGMRAGEAVGLRWSEVDEKHRALRLTATKTGDSTRPMARRVSDLLGGVRPYSDGKGFVFPAVRSGSGSFGGMPRALARIVNDPELAEEDREALTGFGLHHLRHALATTANGLGLTLPTVKALLGHSSGSVTEGYIGRVDSVLIAAADRVAEHIAMALGDSPLEAEVFVMKAKRRPR